MAYQRSVCDIWVLLVEVLLKLWKLIKVPVPLSQPFTRVAKLSWRGSSPVASTSSTKTRGAASIPNVEKENKTKQT